MRTRLSAKIDLVNNLCGLPLSPRDDTGHSIDPNLTSFGKLYSTVSPNSYHMEPCLLNRGIVLFSLRTCVYLYGPWFTY